MMQKAVNSITPSLVLINKKNRLSGNPNFSRTQQKTQVSGQLTSLHTMETQASLRLDG